MNKLILVGCLVNLTVSAVAAAQDGPRRLENPQEMRLPGGSRVEFRNFDSRSLGKQADYSVFLPPAYEDGSDRLFPVVYFLHGLWNDHTSWAVERYGGIPTQLDQLMSAGELAQFIMVCPNGENSFYTDYLDGRHNYERMVFEDLIEHTEKTYRVRSGRESRAVGGVSMGGYGALKIALKHPGLFAAVAGISPIVFTEDPSNYIQNSSSRLAQYLSSALQPIFGLPFDKEHWEKNDLILLSRSCEVDGMRIFFAFGTADRYNSMFPLEVGIRSFSENLSARGIDHIYKVYENGPHGWQLVVEHLQEVTGFLTQAF